MHAEIHSKASRSILSTMFSTRTSVARGSAADGRSTSENHMSLARPLRGFFHQLTSSVCTSADSLLASKSPAVCQSVRCSVVTSQPAVLKRSAKPCLLFRSSEMWSTFRPTTSLKGRVCPSWTRTVRSGCFPKAMPASKRTFGLACGVGSASSGGSLASTYRVPSRATSSPVIRMTTACASSKA